MHVLRPIAASVVAAWLLSSCVTTHNGLPERKGSESVWLQPSPVLRSEIGEQIQRLPWTHGAERVEQIRWLASVGEPAYEQLLPLCLDPRPDVAGSSLAALGATGDHRLVDALHGLDWPADGEMDKGLRLERARTYVRLGDWDQIRTLIDGLRDEELWTRAWCSRALFETTKLRFGYEPKAGPDEREEAVKRWEDWLASRQVEGILNASAERS